MEDLLPVYFIRHNWERPDLQYAIESLYQSRSIGVHFEEIKSPADPFDSKNYKERAGRTAIRYLNDCSDKTALIVASYRNQEHIHIGLSGIGSKQVEVLSGWQIKSLHLEKVKTITMQEFPLPFLIAPPFSTFVKWEMGKLAVNSFYYDYSTKPKVELLSPWHLEILAEEWLRSKHILHRKLFKTGKSMKEMDIVGLSENGQYILTQVKYACSDKIINAFLDNLDTLKNTIGFFFTTESKVDDKRVILFKNIFDDFKKEEKYLKILTLGHL